MPAIAVGSRVWYDMGQSVFVGPNALVLAIDEAPGAYGGAVCSIRVLTLKKKHHDIDEICLSSLHATLASLLLQRKRVAESEMDDASFSLFEAKKRFLFARQAWETELRRQAILRKNLE